MINDFHKIGFKLLAFRKRLSMTQADVAEAAGISDRTYADIERGTVNMRLSTFLQICRVLRVTPNEILMEEDVSEQINPQETLEKLNQRSQKEKSIAYELLNVYLKGLQ